MAVHRFFPLLRRDRQVRNGGVVCFVFGIAARLFGIIPDAELFDFREAFQEPCFDGGIAVCFAVAFRNQFHFIEGYSVFRRAVGGNVILHISNAALPCPGSAAHE